MNNPGIIKCASRVSVRRSFASFLFAFMTAAGGLQAQEFTLQNSSFTAAGQSGGGDFVITSTVGEADVGSGITGGDFSFVPGFWSTLASGAPTLGLVADAGYVVLFWSETAGPDFVLEQTDTLANPSTNTVWSEVNTRPELIGGFYRVRILRGSANGFYRLHKP